MRGAVRFEHRSPLENPSLMGSWCPLCKQFIAATKDPKMLARAESRHECLRSQLETTNTISRKPYP